MRPEGAAKRGDSSPSPAPRGERGTSEGCPEAPESAEARAHRQARCRKYNGPAWGCPTSSRAKDSPLDLVRVLGASKQTKNNNQPSAARAAARSAAKDMHGSRILASPIACLGCLPAAILS